MRYKKKGPEALPRFQGRSSTQEKTADDGRIILRIALDRMGASMIPWVRVDTAEIITARTRQQWTKGQPCPRVLALVELSALAWTGLIEKESISSLAVGWAYSRGKVRRLIADWLDQVQGWQGCEPPSLPGWILALKRADTMRTGGGQEADRQTGLIPDSSGESRTGDGQEADTSRAGSSLIEEEEKKKIPIPAWKLTAWETLCGSLGKSPKLCRLTPARQRQLSQCAKVAREFSQPGERAEETLIAYLYAIPSSENQWMVTRSPSVETPIKPRKIRSYLEAWKSSGELRPADLTAEIAAHLQREIRKHGRSDPPRRRQQDGSWLVCWRFEAPGGVEDTPAYDEALNAALRASGGWGGLFRSPRDQQFAIRDTAKRAGEALRGVSPARFVKR